MEITIATGIDGQWKGEFKQEVRIALDTIIRWLGAPLALEDHQIRALSPRQGYADQDVPQVKGSSTRKPRRDGVDVAEADFRATPRGPQPKPILEFPEPLFDATNDPDSFQGALAYHICRFGESYWRLYRAVIRLDETFNHKTLSSWIEGERVPRSVNSFNILARIERRYQLPQGYFKTKLPHQSRSLLGHDLGDINPAERRRIAWHLPDDFGSLPFSKREEIIDWVRRVIISGSTDYRRYQAAASKQRYAIRFPGVTYGVSPFNGNISGVFEIVGTFVWLDCLDERADIPPGIFNGSLLQGQCGL